MSLFSKNEKKDNQQPKTVTLSIPCRDDDFKYNSDYWHTIKYLPSSITNLLNELGYVRAKGYEEIIEHRLGDYYSSRDIVYVDDDRPLTTFYDAALWLYDEKDIFIEIKVVKPYFLTYAVKDADTGECLFIGTDADGDEKYYDGELETLQKDAILDCCKYLLELEKNNGKR